MHLYQVEKNATVVIQEMVVKKYSLKSKSRADSPRPEGGGGSQSSNPLFASLCIQKFKVGAGAVNWKTTIKSNPKRIAKGKTEQRGFQSNTTELRPLNQAVKSLPKSYHQALVY